jgi:predicted NUDIX family NTP pyrophosphohydrolase
MTTRRNEVSAGILVYRRRAGAIECLLAHPGGPYWARKDAGAWTIPKGTVEAGDALLATAQREFEEETGLHVTGDFIALAPVRQRSGKTVHAFAVEADLDLSGFVSGVFEMEWPPRSKKVQSFPEIDRIAYFALDAALEKIINYQRPFLRELQTRLARV